MKTVIPPRLQQLLAKTSSKIGCYLLKNQQKNYIYIGKAKNIQKRIQTHLSQANNPSAALMARSTHSWETILTNTEKEAFILEQNLIKRHLPRYNVILKDDRRYPYLYISSESRNPKYYLTYKKRIRPGLFYGPFPDQYSCKKLLTLLQNLFPLKRCQQRRGKQPCFWYQLGRCLGACWKTIDKKVYDQQIQKIKRFFRGQIQDIKQDLQTKIALAVENMQFEQAERWKKIHNNLEKFTEQQIVEFNDYIDRDFVNYFRKDDQLLIQVFFYRQGKLQWQTHHWCKLYNDDINETISNYLRSLYAVNTSPQEILIPTSINITILKTIMDKVKIKTPLRGKKAQILQLVADNCQALMANYLHDLTPNEKKRLVLEQLAKVSQQEIVQKFDFIDLSYLNKDLVVGGVTRFRNGWEVRQANSYHVWKNLKTCNEATIFASLIQKEYQNLTTNFPNLILIDGGFLQLKGVVLGLQKIQQTQLQAIGLVKDQKHKTKYLLFPDGHKHIIKNEQLLKFLQNVQEIGHYNTLHRFNNLHQKMQLQN